MTDCRQIGVISFAILGSATELTQAISKAACLADDQDAIMVNRSHPRYGKDLVIHK